jgi:hypothetical protein
MKTTTLAALALAATLPSSKATTIIDLFEYGLKLDGTIHHGYQSAPLPGWAGGTFDVSTGLGTLSVAWASGSHSLSLYVDHEIDQLINTWFNEFGTATGSPVAGQSWEIDEPGYAMPPIYKGDIYDNFLAGTLDNSNGVPQNSPTNNDVAMALGWNVTLAPWQSATAYFTLSESAPTTGGFYLMQADPNSGGAVYFSSVLSVTGSPNGDVPDGGSTLSLLLCAFGGLAGWRSMRKPFP